MGVFFQRKSDVEAVAGGEGGGLEAFGHALADQLGTFQRIAQWREAGYPLGAYFQVPYTFADANNDGIIGVDEVTMGDSARFLGNPFPTRELSVQTNLTVWKNFRLSGLVDYRGGFNQYNATEQFRCTSFNNCEAGYAGFEGVNAPLDAQAAIVASQTFGSQAGYIEEADRMVEHRRGTHLHRAAAEQEVGERLREVADATDPRERAIGERLRHARHVGERHRQDGRPAEPA
mgnify:CR=1 FL=1